MDRELGLVAKLSSILFVTPRPHRVEVLANILDVSIDEIEEALAQIKDLYSDEVNGFSLAEVAGAYQLRTAEAAAPTIKKLIGPRAKRLSKAAAETLAVVAYKQPVQRAEIESIRGVDALPTLKTLLDAKLVRIVGREDSAGQPALYGTTQNFLEKFGLSDLSELPTARELEELAEESGEIDSEAEIEDSSEDRKEQEEYTAAEVSG